jgi:hypothetical protein
MILGGLGRLQFIGADGFESHRLRKLRKRACLVYGALFYFYRTFAAILEG